MSDNLLIISNNASSGSAMASMIVREAPHIQVTTLHSVTKGLEWIRSKEYQKPTAVLLDITAPEEGITAIRAIRTDRPFIPIIALTQYGDHAHAKQLMQAGASDFLAKPVEAARLIISLQHMLKIQRMGNYITWLERKAAGHMDVSDLVGKNSAFQQALALALEAAVSRSPVWITGEEGTGRESFARAIHGSSDQANMPFVVVHCHMLSPSMIEAVLFGTDDTPAKKSRHFSLGKIREADQGTLLLADVDKAPISVQRQLISILNTQTLIFRDAQTPIPVDVRLICTAQAPTMPDDVPEHVEPKLYRRLQNIHIALPSLRERKDDIPLLAEHFLAMYCASENKYIRTLSPCAVKWLCAHSWPGNIRQLARLLWRAVVLATNEVINAEILDAINGQTSYAASEKPQTAVSTLVDGQGYVRPLKSVQEEAIRFALQHANGCMTKAARSLGIGRSTLYRKMSQMKIN